MSWVAILDAVGEIKSYLDNQSVLLFFVGVCYVFLLALWVFCYKRLYRRLSHVREAFYLEVSKVQCKLWRVCIQREKTNPFAHQDQQELLSNTQAILASKHPSFIKHYDKFKQDVGAFETENSTKLVSQEERSNLDSIHKKLCSLKRWYDVVRVGLVVVTWGIFLAFAKEVEV